MTYNDLLPWQVDVWLRESGIHDALEAFRRIEHDEKELVQVEAEMAKHFATCDAPDCELFKHLLVKRAKLLENIAQLQSIPNEIEEN